MLFKEMLLTGIEIPLDRTKCIKEDTNQVDIDESNIEIFIRCVTSGWFRARFNEKIGIHRCTAVIMKNFPNAVCALFDYLYLVIELGS